jgi:hypothetical protein
LTAEPFKLNEYAKFHENGVLSNFNQPVAELAGWARRTFRQPAISPSPRQPKLPLMGALEQVFLLRDRFAERAEKRGKLWVRWGGHW